MQSLNSDAVQEKNPPAKDLPDIYFETTVGKFSVKPEYVKEAGGLSTRWTTSEVKRIETGHSGMYMAWDAHRRPHYQELRKRRADISAIAKKRNCELTKLPFSRNFISTGDIAVVNGGSALFDSVMTDEIRMSLDMNDLFEGVFSNLTHEQQKMHTSRKNSGKIHFERGNFVRNYGWATLNQQLKGVKDVTAPQMISGMTAIDVGRMVAMTSMMRNFASVCDLEEPFSTDPTRTTEFANYLCVRFGLPTKDSNNCPANTVEAMTYGLTSCDPPPINGKSQEPFVFGCHVDQFNCRQPGFNVIFCYYEHFIKDERWYRLSIIVYSRSCVSAYFQRKHSKDVLKNNLTSYISHCLKTGRGTAKLDQLVNSSDVQHGTSNGQLSEDVGDDLLIDIPLVKQALPFMDKASGFLSAPASAIRQILKSNKRLSLQQMCELILPMGWATTYSNLYPLLMEWVRNGLPQSENYTITIIETMVQRHGSFTAGFGPRFQPSFNYSLEEREIEHGLRTLYEVVIDANLGKLSTKDPALKKRMTNICSIGDLGMHHVIHIATIVGVIRNTDFLAWAHIAKGTTTWTNVRANFHLGESVLNRMISDIAEELGLPQLCVENGLCEYCRDCDITLPFDKQAYKESLEGREKSTSGNIRHPDLFFVGQSIFHLEKKKCKPGKRKWDSSPIFESQNWNLIESRWSKVTEGLLPSEERVIVNPILPDEAFAIVPRHWQDDLASKKRSRIIKVSLNSIHKSELNDRKKGKPRMRRKPKHSGIGFHHGLTERLDEGEKRRLQVRSNQNQ